LRPDVSSWFVPPSREAPFSAASDLTDGLCVEERLLPTDGRDVGSRLPGVCKHGGLRAEIIPGSGRAAWGSAEATSDLGAW